MSDNSAKRIKVVFRNDDLSAVSDPEHEACILRMFRQYELPQTFGVVPCMTRGHIASRDRAPVAVLDPSSSIVGMLAEYVTKTESEIALHGYSHQTNRFSKPCRREYTEFRGLSREEQERRITRGRGILRQIFGQDIFTFIPPWNRLDDITLDILKSQGFRAVSCDCYEHASDHLIHFGCNCSIPSFPEVYRMVKSHGNEVFLNLLYHSSTLRDRQEIEMLRKVIETLALDSEVEVLTIRNAVTRYEPELTAVNRGAKAIAALHQVRRSSGARTMIMSSVIAQLPIPDRVVSLRRKGNLMFFGGDYESASAIAAEVEKLCLSRLRLSRVLAVITGMLLGLLPPLSESGLRAVLQISISLGILGLAWLMPWLSTSMDSKREMRMLALLLLLGFGVIQIVLSF